MPFDIAFCLTGDIRANSRALRQLRALKRDGYSVTAVGLADTPATEIVDDVRLQHFQRPSGSGPRWFWHVNRLFRLVLAGIDARLYHASDLFVLPAISHAARTSRRPYTYDSRELYPHVGATAGKPWASVFWRAVEGRDIRNAASTFTVCDSIADRLVSMYGIERPLVVWNVPEYDPVVARSDYLRRWSGAADNEILLLYQGHLKPGRGCEPLVEVAASMAGVRAIFLGNGEYANALRQQAADLGVSSRVHFHEAVPPDRLLQTTAGADVGICLIEPVTESLRLSLPNKLFEYLWAGLPVVGSPLPEIGRIISQFEVGVTADPADPQAIVDAVRRLTTDPDLRNQMAVNTGRVVETFSWRRASDVFLSPFRTLLAA
jgi:glycosyltransferase involved in cell wall biosynthesis